ncbi:hypothetical protein LCGC14_0869610 [marine sediment metagenome]|uniref:Uncharacterized protein n=1 Tax=marine sediment metagenome TaxID=412755 RepID=A0A0F9P563_9ZZZZ
MDEQRIVRIDWVDAIHTNDGWRPLQYYLEKFKTFHSRVHSTVGFLVGETDDYYLVALDIAEATNDVPMLVNQLQLIHKNMVTQIEELQHEHRK